ncbi:MAG: diguanylate cyclase [Solirubrobacterales bacterium]|nr:diguanylate cyclase [Solirubrobacterales bacterium]
MQFDDDLIESEQNVSDFEQTLSDADQTAADDMQHAADSDDAASISDQKGSDSDQAAADRDQESADKEHEQTPPGTAADKTYKRASQERTKSQQNREAASSARQLSVLERASAGVDRDESARVRDRVADARDKAAASRDRREAFEDALVRETIGPEDEHLRKALALSRELRERSAAARQRAADDRARAADDRRLAAEERRLARGELQSAQMDALTGAYMRDLGFLTLEHEILRSRRSEQQFVVAFIDVDGLKQLNDEQGHAAGDELLRKVVEVLRHQLRAYDPVVRVGGDEFICGLVNTDMATARKRAADIEIAVGAAAGSSITIGLAALEPDDSLDELISRADADMYGHKATSTDDPD